MLEKKEKPEFDVSLSDVIIMGILLDLIFLGAIL